MRESRDPQVDPIGERLDSWKEIAAYLKRDVRTVRRWEEDQGLPVRRHRHLKRGTVYALQSELDAWLRARTDVSANQGRAVNQDKETRRARRFWFVLGFGSATVALALVGFGLKPGPSGVAPAPGLWEDQPLTSYAGEEAHPSFSPDGTQVVFTRLQDGQSQSDLFVRVVATGNPLRLTETPESERSPAWSPDGQWIAFARIRGESESELVVMPALGGPERVVARGSIPWDPDLHSVIAWSPDSRHIVATFSESIDTAHGLFAFDLSGPARRALTEASGSGVDCSPALSPDGRTLVFSRLTSRGSSELYKLALDRELRTLSEPERLTNYGAWTTAPFFVGEDSRLYFLSGEPFRAGLWSMDFKRPSEANPVTGLQREMCNVAFSPAARRLVYSRVTFDQNVWKLEITSDGQADTLRRVLDSTRPESNPDLSPDGSLLAFDTTRSGSSEIWLSSPDGDNARQLTYLGNAMTGSPRWSPEGRRIAFDSRVDGQSELFVIGTDGSGLTRLTDSDHNEVLPTWSRDGRYLYHGSDKDGRWQIWRLDLDSSKTSRISTTGCLHGLESEDGQYILCTTDEASAEENELWQLRPSAPQDAQRVLPSLYWYNSFALVDRGILYIPRAENSTGASIRYRRWADGSDIEVARIEQTPGFGMTASRDGRRVLFSRYDQIGEADLLVVDGFPHN